MQSPQTKPEGRDLTPLRSKLVFVTKLGVSILIWISFSRYQGFFAEQPVLYNLGYGLNTFLTGSVLISIGRILLLSWFGRTNRGNARVRSNVVLGINQCAAVLNVILAVLGMMIALNINPREFLTSITLVAMAIALLFRDYITNMISGLLIMFSDRFTVGDYIKIGEYQGRIIDITLSNIVIRNEDDDVVLIPNNTAFTLNIVNQTLENRRKMIVDFYLPIDRAHAKEALEARLLTVIRSMDKQVLLNSVVFRIVSVHHTDVHFKLSFMLHTQAKARKSEIRDQILKAVLAFDESQLTAARSSGV